ncbi:predicted protein [Naegleria gruberi]|uniref:Predicted protein n=1 Tax=Naegleria gruberi TaxID=5762 RepID=D2VPR3_NAEGR|nr:uncharacterized protein NAEGRDRAFT_51287 [Naegleria gruberi]EFC41249.1 predicted protein [Naegleria gruberi]|eukprot:XP_002673993.1 predicted protein [Naegleria gruberi strain NEG-M]
MASLLIGMGFTIFITYASVAEVEYVAGLCGFSLISLGIFTIVLTIIKYNWVAGRGISEIYHYDKLLRPRDSMHEGFLEYNSANYSNATSNNSRYSRQYNDSTYYDPQYEEELKPVGLMRRDNRVSPLTDENGNGFADRAKESFKLTKYCMCNMCVKGCLLITFWIPLLVLSALYLYQSIGYAVDEVLPSGKLMQITLSDGSTYRLHIDCRGDSNNKYPTVVIDSGLGISSSGVYWSDIQSAISNHSKICVYDRAGYGFSDNGYFPRSSLQIVEELNTLLKTSNITEKILLVGHSFGGMNVRLYASKYPESVAGLLLIDPSHENQTTLLRAAEGKSIEPSAIEKDQLIEKAYLNTARVLSPLGFLRLTSAVQGTEIINPFSKPYLTSLQSKTLSFTALSNKQSNVVYSEGTNFATLSAQQVYENRGNGFGNLPLVVLRAGANLNGTCAENHLKEDSELCSQFIKYMIPRAKALDTLVDDILSLSTESSQEIVWGSSHNIAIDNPQAVIENILSLLAKTK